MKSSIIRNCFAVCCISVVLAFTVAANASDIGPIVENACRKCHSPERVCLMLGVKTTEAWERTVKTMVARGAKVPEERIGEAAEYLADLGPGATAFCQ